MSNALLNSIAKIKEIIEEVIARHVQRGAVATDSVIYFLENILYTNSADYQRIYYHALVGKNTPKIFDALSNYSLLDESRYIYPITFRSVNYFLTYQDTRTPLYTLLLDILQVIMRSSIFDFAHYFVLYIINMIIVNRYSISIEEAITKAEDILIQLSYLQAQGIYKITLDTYYESDINITVTIVP